MDTHRRAGRLRFLSLTSELGDTALTLTPALVDSAMAFKPPPRQPSQAVAEGANMAQMLPTAPLAAKTEVQKAHKLSRLPSLLSRAPQQVLHLLFQSPQPGQFCSSHLHIGASYMCGRCRSLLH